MRSNRLMAKRLTRQEINARLAELGDGVQMIGEYRSTKTKTLFKREACGHQWESTPGNALIGRACPHCTGKTQTAETLNAALAGRGLAVVGEVRRMRDPTEFRCSDGHTFSARIDHVKRGSGCSHCSGRVIDMQALINDLAAKGITMLEPYRNSNHKMLFKGACGHTWRAAVYHVRAVSGCPYCANTGAKSCAFSYVYVMAYANGLTKIGVSNDPIRRLVKLRRAAREHIELTAAYEFGDGTGRAAWEAEQEAHAHFAEYNAGLNTFDGSTELFSITPAAACAYLRWVGGQLADLGDVELLCSLEEI